MADTLPNIPIPAGTWVDLYDASSIAVGTQIRVKLLGGSAEVKLVTQAAQPTDFSAYDVLVDRTVPAINDTGDSGAWAFSVADALVNVEVV